jgi:hypothetical protein
MKLARLIALTIATAIAAAISGQAQTEKAPTGTEGPVASEKMPVQIVSHKIGTEYYPMLDRPGSTSQPMTADTGDIPITENERIARQNSNANSRTTRRDSTAPVAPEDKRSRGRLRSYTRVIDNAQQVQVVLKNTGEKPIQSVDWDFAFPRYENGVLLSRFDVTTKAEIKPGGKKTLKFKLPEGAKKCEVVRVVNDENQPEKTNTFEAVCGAGFHDPSLLNQKQETISVKRIAYADGSVWPKKE